MKISRRVFLIMGIAILAAPLLLTLARRQDQLSWLKMVLRKRLPDLNIDDADLDIFIGQYLEHDAFRSGRAANTIMLEQQLGYNIRTILPRSWIRKANQEEELLLTRFFLSTDYLLKAEKTEPLTLLLGYGNPYISGCANPLAQEMAT